jgi:CRISPR-associated protein Cas5d
MTPDNRVTLRVWGDFACFTRPEMKVERVSYPAMTPSAARGVLEAVFWEPEMYYLVDTIRIVKRGKWFSCRRNEVTNVISIDSAKQWSKSPDKVSPIHAGGGAPDGTQRNMLALEGVEYLVTAEVRLSDLADRSRCNIQKYLDQIRRRARSGKCFYRPCLGVREFAADFDFVDDAEAAFAASGAEPIPYEPLGLMLYDVFDWRQFKQGFKWLKPEDLAEARARFEAGLAGLKKGDRTKALKTYDADPARRFAGVAIEPKPSFFQAEIRANAMHCHPEDVKILFADDKED